MKKIALDEHVGHSGELLHDNGRGQQQHSDGQLAGGKRPARRETGIKSYARGLAWTLAQETTAPRNT